MVHSVVAHGGNVWASHSHVLYKFGANLEKEAETSQDLSGLTITAGGSYIVGITADSKQVLVLDSSDIQTVKASHEFPKRPSGISISGEDLVVGDKFGDVFHRKLSESSTTPKDCEPILGHVSMVLDVKFASPNFVISSDRDEHIRISRFPKSYVIERFLLGHDSFVSHLAVDGDYLLSAGGDSYVLSWNWQTGERLAKLEVEGNVIAMSSSNSVAYIAVENSHTVLQVSIPDLAVIKTVELNGPVQALASSGEKCYAALPTEIVEVGGDSRYTFESEDSETNSELHLKKRP